jgi:hypothetical protein
MSDSSCVKKDLTSIAPFVGCNNPYYTGNNCENIKCDDTSILNFYVGGGTKCLHCIFGSAYFYINDNILQYCKDPSKPVSKFNSLYTTEKNGKKFCETTDNPDYNMKCDVTCGG